MGFLKDVSKLSKQGREMQKNMDVKAQMATGMASMQAASVMMQQQTVAAQVSTTGVATTATVVAVRPTGMQINLAPVVEMDLTVFRNGVPVPATRREAVHQVYLARLQVGATLHVKYDPADPSALWIDWVSPA